MNQTKSTSALSGTEIACYRSKERATVRVVSDLAVREEALHDTRWVGLYWSCVGQVNREEHAAGLPDLDPLFHPLQAFDLEIDGQSLHNRWDWVEAGQRPGARSGTVESVVHLRHQVRPVAVRVVTRVDGTSALARYLEITNTGDRPAALARVSPLSGLLWNTPQWRWKSPDRLGTEFPLNPAIQDPSQPAFRLGYQRSRNQGHEGDFLWQDLSAETLRIERQAHAHGAPYFLVANRITGESFLIALAWSGAWWAEFAYRDAHDRHLLSFSAGPAGPAPLRVLAPGETITSPEVHILPLHCDQDEAVNRWHEHLRRSVLPPRPAGKAMYTVAGRVVEHPGDWILREVDIAAEMGIEAFMVDAGWYGRAFAGWWDHRGDWFEGDWLPGGLAGIREHTRSKGMLFGLWHEAEGCTPASDLAKAHPDWLLRTDSGRACADALDLANPEAARFFEETVLRLIREHRLDFYKLDHNTYCGEGGQRLVHGFAESEFARHYETVYRTFDRALAEHPDCCLENCAAGGGRNDLAMLARFHYLCESDFSFFPYSIRAINALTLFLPPEALCYYHNHMPNLAHLTVDLDSHLRVCLFCLPIFVGFGAQGADRATRFFERTKYYIALHKGFCRPVLAGPPVVHHHTPDIGLFQPAPWCVLEYSLADRSRGYVGAFQLVNDAPEYLLRPRGVDPSADYEVTLDNHGEVLRVSGRELRQRGLVIPPATGMTSELAMYRRL